MYIYIMFMFTYYGYIAPLTQPRQPEILIMVGDGRNINEGG